MKKFILCFILCFTMILASFANDNFPATKYSYIGQKDKISYDPSTDSWSRKVNKKNGNYYVKTKGFGDFYDYNDSNGNFAFSTNCEFEFINNKNFIGYSNRDMRFYYITYINDGIGKRALTKQEVEALFPEYKIISLSDFNQNTNSLKIKKHIGNLKILLFNDTDKTYENYKFSSGNAKYEQYSLRGFLNVSKPGMIQFSGTETTPDNPMYVLLVR